MSREELQRVDDRWLADLNKHDVEKLVDNLADDFVWYDWGLPEPLKDKEAARRHLKEGFIAFPDMLVRQTRRVIGDDALAAEIEWTGTNTGPMAVGDNQIPPTNRSVIGRGSYIFRIRNGKIVEISAHPDIAGMMMQLGFMPQM